MLVTPYELCPTIFRERDELSLLLAHYQNLDMLSYGLIPRSKKNYLGWQDRDTTENTVQTAAFDLNTQTHLGNAVRIKPHVCVCRPIRIMSFQLDGGFNA